jgi:heme/copper-type cytochrome/quinol oxidase subunit 3
MSTVDIAVHEHHESPEAIAGRQLVGVWLFIAGDAVILMALLFTYLYLRGLNTSQSWMPAGVHGASALMAWLIVVVVAASAAMMWFGERATQRGGTGTPSVLFSAVLALVGVVLSAVAISQVPHAVNATSGVNQVAGSYASALLAIDVSNLFHLALLIFLALAVASRIKKGLITVSSPTHIRLVRIFWVWVALSVTLAAITSTIFVASPK